MPSCPGERRTWPSASGERTLNVGARAPPGGGGRAADAERPGRAQDVAQRQRRAHAERRAARAVRGGQLRAVPEADGERPVGQRLAERLAQGLRAHARTVLAAWRSGETRTTSWASPHFSNPR